MSFWQHRSLGTPAREEWVHRATMGRSVIRCNFSRKLHSFPFQSWKIMHESSRNGSLLLLEGLGCSIRRKGPLSDFNWKRWWTAMPFSLGSQSQRKEVTENKTGVYRGETDNGRAGGAWIVSYCLYWNGLDAKKMHCTCKVQSAHFVCKYRWCL